MDTAGYGRSLQQSVPAALTSAADLHGSTQGAHFLSTITRIPWVNETPACQRAAKPSDMRSSTSGPWLTRGVKHSAADPVSRTARGHLAGGTARCPRSVCRQFPAQRHVLEPGNPAAASQARVPRNDASIRQVGHPGNLGGSDSWEDAGSWRHRRSTRMSCANAR